MDFGGFQKLTVLDYPSHVACIVFTKGCNFRCPFCHNSFLVENCAEQISSEEILLYLKKRKGVLDGVSVTGGEPLMHQGIVDFIKEVKALGYDVKVDTNGTFPERLKELVESSLVDYVAMDIKNSPEKYDITAGAKTDISKIQESIDFLLSAKVDYEFRTTVTNELHTPQDIVSISKWISGAKRYFVQNFVDSGNILTSGMTPVSPETLEEMALCAKDNVQFVKIR